MPARTRSVRTKKPYHHGDLRRALLDAALGMLGEPGGAGLLTLREVARRAGVTHAAPYRHFASKEALLAAVAEEGFRRMHQEMRARVAPFGADPARQHLELGVAYVLFAAAHPAHFRVMFGAALSFELPGLGEVAQATFRELVDSIIRCQQAGLMRPGDPMELAIASWSIVHGLSQLVIDGRLEPTGWAPEDAERLAGVVGRMLHEGLFLRQAGA